MTRRLSLMEGHSNCFKIVPLEEARSILVFDMSNLGHRAINTPAFAQMEYKGRPTGAVFGAFRNLTAFVKRARPPIALVYALDGYPEKRYELYPEYKGNRDRDGRGDPIPDVTKLARLLPGYRIKLPKWEADDAIASFVTHYQTLSSPAAAALGLDDGNHDDGLDGTVYVVSADQDLLQLVSPKVKWWRSSKEPPFSGLEILETHGDGEIMAPELVLMHKCLFGDSSDNIKGIPRLPREKIEGFITASNGDWGAFKKLVMSFDGKLTAALKRDWAIVQRNRKLVQLRVRPLTPRPNDTSQEALSEFVVKDLGCKSLQLDINRYFPG